MPDYPFFFTWTSQDRAAPIHLTGGEGAWFDTSDGGRWLDLGSLIYQANLGHGHPRMVEALHRQVSRLCLSIPGGVYPQKRELAERLLELAGEGFTKVFFTLGGSDANENAMKMAKLVTGRHKMMARYRSYHGATMGAVTLSGDWRRPPVEPGLVGVVHVADFDCDHCPYGTRSPECDHEPITRIPRALELEGPETVAAVFVEAVGGGNGVLIPPPGAMTRVREACDRHGTLLVVDEVLSGFGRTGRWFGHQHEAGLVPDLITLGKALTGGYGTLGAVLVHQRVAQHFDERTLFAGLTHYGHPLGIAAALEAIRIYEEEHLIERAAELEPVLRSALSLLTERYPNLVRQHRVIGLLSATELSLDAEGWRRLSAALRANRVHAHVKPQADALILAPPLCITAEELMEGISRVDRSIEEATK